jgi:undecaprenyl diphosphate synthase
LEKLANEGVRVRIAGERDSLQPDVRAIVDNVEARTRHNSRFNLTIAFNYGGQDEIVRAARRVAEDVAAGKLAPSDVNAAAIEARLDTHELPPPDLIIRTSGETRLSNFLLWQAAYAELVFQDVLWPDFDKASLEAAIAAYAQRERRYGASETSA